MNVRTFMQTSHLMIYNSVQRARILLKLHDVIHVHTPAVWNALVYVTSSYAVIFGRIRAR